MGSLYDLIQFNCFDEWGVVDGDRSGSKVGVQNETNPGVINKMKL